MFCFDGLGDPCTPFLGRRHQRLDHNRFEKHQHPRLYSSDAHFYSFDDRYLLTATIRRDGSSKFADGEKWGWFPAVALAWRASQESFLRDVQWLYNAKLRLGWGKTGNQNVTDYAYMALLANKTTPWGVGVLTGNTANPKLTWESTSSYNLGVDFGVLQNRIELVADLYYKRPTTSCSAPAPQLPRICRPRRDQQPLGQRRLYRKQGYRTRPQHKPTSAPRLTWTSNVVFSLNRNKVKSRTPPTPRSRKPISQALPTTIVTKTVVGQPIGQFWGYK